jgi:hypothetical protein
VASVILVRRWDQLWAWFIAAGLIWIVGTWKYYPFALGLMLLSGGWMILLSIQRGFPEAVDPSRAYLGTDTHAFGLFAGAALAALWDPRARRISQPEPTVVTSSPWGQAPATRIDWLGMVALALLLGAMLLVGSFSILGTGPFFGTLLIALLSL